MINKIYLFSVIIALIYFTYFYLYYSHIHMFLSSKDDVFQVL